ncbi:MAG: alpha/beta hydrolase [Anaerolineae bacterium]|nr:alpha/beta hydrolase [Anaerolineae bacterium]
MKLPRNLKRVLLVLLLVLLLAVAGFAAWAYTPLGPMPEALAALQSDATVEVTTSPWLTFTPAGSQPTTGFIIYPGGRVDARSYAPVARAIAERGYLVVIVPMPFNLAVFNPAAADGVIAAHPEIRRWAVGGHSLGGAMAANYAYTHPNAVQGLVLWASYPASNNSLADRSLAAITIYATEDGLATPAKIEASLPLLPANSRVLMIGGGNHAGFGWYGPQGGDGQATISRAEQQAQVVGATVMLLAELSER